MKEDVEDSIDLEDIPIEEGREIIMIESKEQNDGGEATTFIENENVDIPTTFSPKLSDPGSFSIPCIMGKVKIERALCDLGASVSIMPYSLFHKLHLVPLQDTPFSLQLADGSEMQPIGTLDNVPANIGDIWVLEDLSLIHI